MRIVIPDVDKELVSIIHSINKDPASWKNWMCLHIETATLGNVEGASEALDSISVLLESYLDDIEGAAFFCDLGEIYVICKNVSDTTLREIGRHISDLVLLEYTSVPNLETYDIFLEGPRIADIYYSKGNRFLTLPSPQASGRKHIGLNPALFPKEQPTTLTIEQRKSLKVLLVDDDPVTRWLVRNSLKYVCQFATAQDGNKALASYKSYLPDIVFLDINLPDKDGLSVLRWIIGHDPGAYIVMFSGESQLDNLVTALEDGAKGFIAKPFMKEQLLHYLDSCPKLH